MRRAARTDANHSEIVAALIKAGASVQSLAMVGVGCPDVLVGFRGETHLLEIKDSEQPPNKRALTPAQKKFHAIWRGRPIVVVETVADALAAVGVR